MCVCDVHVAVVMMVRKDKAAGQKLKKKWNEMMTIMTKMLFFEANEKKN